ncbi:MAG: hypothetical protein OXN22_04160, partial [Deltaproteobacteria bacterium]|nr:hypothetical protein [Deltaproteobacteria bacterium]
FLKRAKDNHRPLPPIDAKSARLAATTFQQALDQGALDKGVYWENHDDASGYATGGVTVLTTGRTEDRRQCREVLIETAMNAGATDQRVRTLKTGVETYVLVVGILWSCGDPGATLRPGQPEELPQG